MTITPRLVLLTLLLVISAVLVLEGFFFLRLINESTRLGEIAQPYRQLNLSGTKLFVLGDSYALGVGAATSSESIAGYIGADLPRLGIANVSASGLQIEDVVRTLENLKDEQFDVVLLQVGSNDVLRFTSKKKLSEQVDIMLSRSRAIGSRVVWMGSNNVGSEPIFPFPLDLVLSLRSNSIRELFMDKANEHGVVYIDLYKSRADDPFLEDKGLYFASDRFHPSSDGYRIWYEQLKTQLESEGILYGQ